MSIILPSPYTLGTLYLTLVEVTSVIPISLCNASNFGNGESNPPSYVS